VSNLLLRMLVHTVKTLPLGRQFLFVTRKLPEFVKHFTGNWRIICSPVFPLEDSAMKRIAFALPLLLLACVARQPVNEPVVTSSPPEAAIKLSDILPEGHRAGAAVEINGARIVAIVAENAPVDTAYLVLHEALEAGVCTVRETGASEDGNVSGDVNTLLVSNTGDKPIFLMAGDLVLGGKQDRVLAESLVVDPGVTDMPIPVFCVEQGRWSTQARDGVEGAAGLFSNTAQQGQVDMSVKSRAIGARDQGAVWQQVETANRALGVEASSGTFRAAYDDEDSLERIEAEYKKAAGLVGTNVVGFAVIHDGEVAAMDVFESSGLANKLSEKLLRSYIITAIAGGYATAPSNPNAGIFFNNQDPDNPPVNFSQSMGSRMVHLDDDGNEVSQTEQEPMPPTEVAPNARTLNVREAEGNTLRYSCEDKTTGRRVQTSYMRR
jgi:hypothetical protein